MEFFQANIIPAEVIVQLIAFLIVFFTLQRLAWKPIQGAMAHRRESIAGEFDKIEKARKEIEALKAEYSNHLKRIEEESRVKLQQSIDEGRRIAREIQDKAREEAQAAFEKGKENLSMEVAKARTELRREIAGLAIEAAERVLNEKLSDDKKQNEKILEIIQDLEKSL